MPDAERILSDLTQIARDGLAFAMLWHAAAVLALWALGRGWRPSGRTVAHLMLAPFVSVAIFAGVYGNPFNASVFGAAVLVLLALSMRVPRGDVAAFHPRLSLLGAFMLAFAWVYPHFLEDRSPLVYLYAAPLGLLPCPTLAAAVGFALLGDGFGSRAFGMTLATLGVFYGLFGAIRLGVHIDLILAAGALALGLAVRNLRQRAPSSNRNTRSRRSEKPAQGRAHA
jgi:hypothetical protein